MDRRDFNKILGILPFITIPQRQEEEVLQGIFWADPNVESARFIRMGPPPEGIKFGYQGD